MQGHIRLGHTSMRGVASAESVSFNGVLTHANEPDGIFHGYLFLTSSILTLPLLALLFFFFLLDLESEFLPPFAFVTDRKSRISPRVMIRSQRTTSCASWALISSKEAVR